MELLAPAVCVPVPVTTNFVAAPGFNVILGPTIPVPLVGANVILKVPDTPVNVKPKLVKLATPLTKSPEPVNLLPPDNPDIAPDKLGINVMLFADASNPVAVLP
ncbi:hypothetical protein AQAU111925_09280 [Aquirufa aurantiipilula]